MESVKRLDSTFRKGGVFFLPWIGPKFLNRGFEGRKLLIVGESHYDEWDGKKHHLGCYFTRGCIEEVSLRDQYAASFWRYIEQALLNEERLEGWAPNGGEKFWAEIAFYNFVQTPVPGDANAKPAPRQFTDSWDAFRTVIEALQPDRILVCGYKRLWEQMPPTPYDNDRARKDVWRHDRIQAYVLQGGKKAWCMAIKHPSRGFSWRKWHPVISAFLRSPSAAVSLLEVLLVS